MKLRSLRVRLLLMFMLVVIVAVGAAESFANRTTTNAFEGYVRSEKNNLGPIFVSKTLSRDTQSITSVLLTAYNRHQDPKTLQTLVGEEATVAGMRIILVDHNMHVIADSSRALTGKEIVTPDTKFVSMTGPGANLLSTSNVPILLISTDMQLPVQPRVASPSPEQSFLGSVNLSSWLAFILALLVALLLTLLGSQQIIKPVKALTLVANRMEQGDLSQRVRIRRKDEIGALAHAFNTMADSLQHLEQLRRNLVSDVAHELRTPLTNIRGYLEALQDQVVEPTREIISSLYEESLLLSRLVADLQELSLAEAGQLCLVRVPVSLEEITVKAVHALHMQAASKQLSIWVDIPPGLPLIEADPERLGQILRNLLSNAVTHTPAGGEIHVRAYVTDSDVHVSVQDSGEGISAQHLPYVFERFYRADSSRARATGGTGLGLAIVKQMVQTYGGRVEVESQPGQGACFTFTLPVVVTGQPAGI